VRKKRSEGLRKSHEWKTLYTGSTPVFKFQQYIEYALSF